MTPLHSCLLVSTLLFCIGFAGVLTRRHPIAVLIGIELMLNAANLNFIAFWRFGPNPEALTGIMFVLFSIGIAAAEAAVGLALVILIYRHYRQADLTLLTQLKDHNNRSADEPENGGTAQRMAPARAAGAGTIEPSQSP